LPPEEASLPALGKVLRELRRQQARRSGERQLTYRELAGRTGWSHGILGEYFAGRVLPPTDRFDLLVRLLGASPAEQGALATLRDRGEEQRRGDRRPRELPAAGSGIVGRDAELSDLDAMLAGGTPVVISGMAGVGKTTLALHWAHRIAARFPDGQLHLNLRGFHPEGAMSAGEALNTLLSSLGVAAPRIPPDLEARAGLYRTLLRDRRVLVVHPGPDLTAPVAAALGGLDVAPAGVIMAELAQARLVVEHRPGRFACHDLLRAYAAELSESTDPAAATLDSLGTVRHRLGDHPAAIAHFRALALFARQGDRISQADTLGRLGEAQLAAGDVAAVREAWRQALALLEEVGHPGVADARARLAALGPQP